MLAGLLPLCTQAESACPAPRLDEIARVSYVHDGDTVRLDDGRKIRLIGINTPELARDAMPEQAYARKARELLKAAISSHGNRVGLVYGDERHDPYNRILAHLFTPTGDNLQAQLLAQGMAASIAHPPNTAFSACYLQQEQTARCNARGLWSNPDQTIIQASELDADSRGFQLVTGKVDAVKRTDNSILIFMPKLMIQVRNEDLSYFDPATLLSLGGKQLMLRGWLLPRSRNPAGKKLNGDTTVEYYMRLRHPSAMEINRVSDSRKC